jgi:hypothetical protein
VLVSLGLKSAIRRLENRVVELGRVPSLRLWYDSCLESLRGSGIVGGRVRELRHGQVELGGEKPDAESLEECAAWCFRCERSDRASTNRGRVGCDRFVYENVRTGVAITPKAPRTVEIGLKQRYPSSILLR